MYRPAGMSDDEEDSNDFYFEDKLLNNDATSSNNSPSISEKEMFNYSSITCNSEQKHIEYHVIINACIIGDIKKIQDYQKSIEHDINKTLPTGWTLLLYATSSVQSELVKYLLKHKADPNKHKDGFTPLMALCSNSTKSMIQESLKCLDLLIQAKADVNIINKHRETALMYACKLQDAKFVAELIKYVKDINACDSDGKTALHYAAAANKLDTIKILLKHNIDISLVDTYNMSAKDIADAKAFKEISALLTDDKEEISTFYEIFQIRSWKDLFPDLYPKNKKTLDYDISVILEGMGLQQYGILFQGMDLKTFLQLTEDDLCQLGFDITVHREQFLQDLERFHNRKWHIKSFGFIKNSDSYTLYDGIIALTNVRKHINIITSSFQYIKNNWIKAANENIHLSATQQMDYEKQLRKIQSNLKSLKNEIMYIKKLAKKIDKESNLGVPATFIGPKKNTKSFNWTTTINITLSITIIVGLYFCKTTCV